MFTTSEPIFDTEHQQWVCTILYRGSAYAASYALSADGAKAFAGELIALLKAAGFPKPDSRLG